MNDPAVASSAISFATTDSVARFASNGPEHCIDRRADGVYADPEVLGTTLVAAVDGVLRSNHYFSDLDYPVLIKALYGHGPELPRDAAGRAVVRFAADILPFAQERRALYRAVKIADGQAEYYFEPVFRTDDEGVERATTLDADEFVADLWGKGVRFGVDLDAIRNAIVSGAAGRIVVARRLEASSGIDARVEEVTGDLHRSDAPRQLANGKLDLMSFQNRFPQIARGKRLLRKVPASVGAPGFDLAGIPIAPEPPRDLDLSVYAADGTEVAQCEDGEFLVARQDGFLSVDPKSSRISISDKIVSHDGVSAKTTGNLHLSGDYEEFGEVQEQRVIEGDSITVHADVFGHVVSRGGTIRLERNLVGGSARNAKGDIQVLGVTSNATIQTAQGEVTLQRAENCVISGTRVKVERAINCEIMGDEVEVASAEGGAIAGRRVSIGRAAPRRQGEMLVYVLRPDCARIDDAMAQVSARLEGFGQLLARHRTAIETLGAQPDLRKYLMLAPRLRKGELVLTPEQEPQFKRLTAAVTPALKEMARLSQLDKAAEGERHAGQALLARLETQRGERLGAAGVAIGALAGEVQVRAMAYEPDAGNAYDLPPREIKARLRDGSGAELLHAGTNGAWNWCTDPAQQMPVLADVYVH
ncbi:flagellar assembly protein A [Massilia sp.]|uniref:flagellar assembly protein A n=1 Tax=Massilia sp. TaxID=1882437 RepID=UPI00289F2138|nr:flagellar assembly protein A [Massilia sp.]